MVDIKDIPWVKQVRPKWDENNDEMQRIWLRLFKTGARNIMMAFIVLLMLAFTAGTAGATDQNTTGNETPAVNDTGTPTLTATVTATSTAVAGDAEDDDYKPDKGVVGPGNALYGLRIAFQRLDIVFTFNKSEKLGKQVSYARHRIKELRASLDENDTEAANIALGEFKEEMEEINKSVSEFSDKSTGLINAQMMIAKHQEVLKELVDSHPGNTGLARAYDNSLELKEKFESRTGKGFAIIAKKGKKVMEEIEIDEIKDKLKIKAEITGNITKIKVDAKFASNATDNFTIAQEILNRLKLSEENINSILEIETEDEEENNTLKENMKAEAEVIGNISKVGFEHRFPLNVTNRSDIAEGIYQKLSALTTADILNVLEIKIKKEERAEIKQRGKELEKSVKEEIGEKEEMIKENEKRVKEEMRENENR